MTIIQKLENTDNILSDDNISVRDKKKAISIIDKIKELIKNGYHFDDDFEIAEKNRKETENG